MKYVSNKRSLHLKTALKSIQEKNDFCLQFKVPFLAFILHCILLSNTVYMLELERQQHQSPEDQMDGHSPVISFCLNQKCFSKRTKEGHQCDKTASNLLGSSIHHDKQHYQYPISALIHYYLYQEDQFHQGGKDTLQYSQQNGISVTPWIFLQRNADNYVLPSFPLFALLL